MHLTRMKEGLRHRARRVVRTYRPMLEQLEDRQLLAVLLLPQGNVNATVQTGFNSFNDNQAEATIAINPTNPQNLFAASVTFHGSQAGRFSPSSINPLDFSNKPRDVSGIQPDTTPGLFVAYSQSGGTAGSWISRIFATGGPGSTINERSLPAALDDPQTAFDDYGNLFLTYRTPPVLQFGEQSAIGVDTLTDNTRQWVQSMWAGRFLTIFTPPNVIPGFPQGAFETKAIIPNTDTTGTQITVAAAWTPAIRAAATAYTITVNGYYPAPWNGIPWDQNAVVVVKSSDGGANFQFMKILDSGSGAPFNVPSVDYPAIATGPGRGPAERSVWVTWKQANRGRILAAGAATTGLGAIGDFFPTQIVNNAGTGDVSLPRVQIGPVGQVMVSYHTLSTGMTPTNVYVNVDDDGLFPGEFTATLDAMPVTTTNIVATGPARPDTAKIPAQPTRGITPQVNLAWDRSGWFGNPNDRRVYMVYTDSVAINDHDTSVYVVWSDDSGRNWNPRDAFFGFLSPRRVHIENTQSQFLPSIAVDQIWGTVAVVWLDAREDPLANTLVKLYGTVSVDGGTTFEPEIPIAVGRSNATLAGKQQRGTTTGPSGNNTLIDANQNWRPGAVPANYWKKYQVDVYGDPGQETRIVTANEATQLTVDANWGTNPGPGRNYELRTQPRPTGMGLPPFPARSYDFDFGEYTGLVFHDGWFFPIWADNSNSTGDNINGLLRAFDLYTDAVAVVAAGGAESASSGGITIRIGTDSFTAVPSSNLLEAALLLLARRFYLTGPPSESAFARFVVQMYSVTQRLADLASRSPTSTARLLLGGATPRPAPSLAAVDTFFRAAWADGVLSAADILIRLG